MKNKKVIHVMKSLSSKLEINILQVKTELGNSSDVVVTQLKINKDIECAIVYISSLVDKNSINTLSLEEATTLLEKNKHWRDTAFDTIKNAIIGFKEATVAQDYDTLCNSLLAGNTVFLIDGYNKFFAIETKSDEGRSISEPTSQTTIRGPKDCFIENVNSNILLIRKRINNKRLIAEYLTVGTESKTKVSLMYLNQVAKDEIVREVRKRIKNIQIDGILDSGYIEELIKDNRLSIFPEFLSSERPDTVAAALMEGKIAILVDGSPYVITAPAVFSEFLQSSEDYYHNFITASVIRLIRYFSFFLTLLTPAIYIAVTTYHQEIIPTQLLVSIAAQREGVPFPSFIEAVIMEGTFEILREAGIRMPRAVGPAISIVGALVLGQAAVEAGIISAAIVIVVALTAISSFAIPSYDLGKSVRLLRFILMILSAVMGLYGVFMGLIVLVLHLCNIKSIGIPYLTYIAPKVSGFNKDIFTRLPHWKMKFKPVGTSNDNSPRISNKKILNKDNKKNPEFR